MPLLPRIPTQPPVPLRRESASNPVAIFCSYFLVSPIVKFIARIAIQYRGQHLFVRFLKFMFSSVLNRSSTKQTDFWCSVSRIVPGSICRLLIDCSIGQQPRLIHRTQEPLSAVSLAVSQEPYSSLSLDCTSIANVKGSAESSVSHQAKIFANWLDSQLQKKLLRTHWRRPPSFEKLTYGRESRALLRYTFPPA